MLTVSADVTVPGVIVLIGPPGSGKTSLRNDLLKYSDDNVVYVSSDEIREHKKQSNAVYNNDVVFREAKDKLYNYLSEGKCVIWDATSCNQLHRAGLVGKIRRKFPEAYVLGIVFNTSLRDCLNRNATRIKPVPEDVVIRMYQQLRDKPPAISEGFQGIISSETMLTYNKREESERTIQE